MALQRHPHGSIADLDFLSGVSAIISESPKFIELLTIS
jgi:hypothetical protein